jgi:hypothetical protein
MGSRSRGEVTIVAGVAGSVAGVALAETAGVQHTLMTRCTIAERESFPTAQVRPRPRCRLLTVSEPAN